MTDEHTAEDEARYGMSAEDYARKIEREHLDHPMRDYEPPGSRPPTRTRSAI